MDLSSLNLESLGDIMSSLSEDDIEKLSSLAQELFQSEKEESTKRKEKSPKDDLFSKIDPMMMGRLMGIINKLSSAPNDPRCDFITSLKPLLSKDKQQKADEAIKLLQLLSLMPLLGDTFK